MEQPAQAPRIIETTAPIGLNELKEYFTDKNVTYVIDYQQSKLQENKLLTYISNLDLPIDIKFDPKSPEGLELIKNYMSTQAVVDVPSLEIAVLDILFDYRFKEEITPFVAENKELIDLWCRILDSLTLYNMGIVEDEELSKFPQQFPEENISPNASLNFVNLLKYPGFYVFYEKIDKSHLTFFKNLFEEYIYKGKSLYEYWAVGANPLFLLTYGIASGALDEKCQLVEDIKPVQTEPTQKES